MRRHASAHAVAAAVMAAGWARVQAADAPPATDGGISLDEHVSVVRDAVWALTPQGSTDPMWWAETVHEDHVIARHGIKTYRIAYTIDADGKVVLGERTEVEAQYVPVEVEVAVSASRVRARLHAAEGDATGSEWEVVVLEEGMSSAAAMLANGTQLPTLFTGTYLDSLVPLLEGCRVFALDDTTTGHKRDAGAKRQEQIAGFLTGARREGKQILATLHFNPAGTGADKAKTLANAWRKGVRNLFGLSIDAFGTGEVVREGARRVWRALTATSCDSVDIVVHPGAGGRFVQLLASAGELPHNNTNNGINGGGMKKRAVLLAHLQATRPAALANLDPATASLDELMGVATTAEIAAAFADDGAAPAAAGTQAAAAGGVSAAEVAVQVTAAMQLRGRKEAIINASRLPDRALQDVRRMLDDPTVTEAQTQAAVDNMREILASASAAPVYGLGGVRASAGVDFQMGVTELERLEAACDRAFGLVPTNPALATIQAMSLRPLYQHLTLGLDESVQGSFSAEQLGRIHAAGFAEDTFASMLIASMQRRLVADYGELDHGAANLVSHEGAATDFRPQEAVRWGYLSNLPVLNTDDDPYPEVAAYGEERTTYSVEERGYILNVSRRHIIGDDMGHVAKIPGKMARAGRQTVSRYIFSFAVSNPVIPLTPGTLTWAHATRNNLITEGLSIAGLNAAASRLWNQTEPGSGEKLGLTIKHLFIPHSLRGTAYAINQSQYDPDYPGEQRANPWYQYFGANNEAIHVVPYMTDGNDWFVCADKSQVELIELKYLNGQKTPIIVRADAPGAGRMLSHGGLQIKAYFDFAGTPVDFRGWVKSVVPEL
jgi:hypothetical protein